MNFFFKSFAKGLLCIGVIGLGSLICLKTVFPNKIVYSNFYKDVDTKTINHKQTNSKQMVSTVYGIITISALLIIIFTRNIELVLTFSFIMFILTHQFMNIFSIITLCELGISESETINKM